MRARSRSHPITTYENDSDKTSTVKYTVVTKRCYRLYFVAFLHFASDYDYYYYCYCTSYCWLRPLNRLPNRRAIISGGRSNTVDYTKIIKIIIFGDRSGNTVADRVVRLLLLFGLHVFFLSFFSFFFLLIFCRHLRFDFFIVRQIYSLARQVSSCHSKMMMVFWFIPVVFIRLAHTRDE